jgi:hypothetical protein
MVEFTLPIRFVDDEKGDAVKRAVSAQEAQYINNQIKNDSVDKVSSDSWIYCSGDSVYVGHHVGNDVVQTIKLEDCKDGTCDITAGLASRDTHDAWVGKSATVGTFSPKDDVMQRIKQELCVPKE